MPHTPHQIALILLLVCGSARGAYLFDRQICTGLGDRLGTMLSLAALAHLKGETVVFQWCTTGAEFDGLSHLKQHIPDWQGYAYPPAHHVQEVLSLPAEIHLVHANLTEAERNLPQVMERWTRDAQSLPAVEGLDAVYSYAWRVYQLGDDPASGEQFQAAYHKVCSPMVARARRASRGTYVAVHLRLRDNNTYAPYPSEYENGRLYCTGKVIRRLLKAGHRLLAVSNDPELAAELLDGRVEVVQNGDPVEDLSLLLGASAIVQHMWRGWSAFSSVPALAARIPLLTTFKGTYHHRLDFFRQYGPLPEEMYECHQMDAFERALHSIHPLH